MVHRIAFIPIVALLMVIPSAADAKTKLYVSLGDSYATGFQPGMGNTRDGFVYQVPGLARKKGVKLKVVNFGCAGATTASLVRQKGCPKKALGPGAKPYKTTQLKAASSFIRKHRKQIALITVSIGGNDVTACVNSEQPIDCVGKASESIKANVGTTASTLRKAAGNKPMLVGTTYPNVVLGAWVNPGTEASKELAGLSTLAFQALINPALQESYAKGQGRFVDVTARTGAYGDMGNLVELAPYGLIPGPVAEVCKISWYCSKRDIHANGAGYRIIAEMVVAEL